MSLSLYCQSVPVPSCEYYICRKPWKISGSDEARTLEKRSTATHWWRKAFDLFFVWQIHCRQIQGKLSIVGLHRCDWPQVSLSMRLTWSFFVSVTDLKFLCHCDWPQVSLSAWLTSSFFVSVTDLKFLCQCDRPQVSLSAWLTWSFFVNMTDLKFLCQSDWPQVNVTYLNRMCEWTLSLDQYKI